MSGLVWIIAIYGAVAVFITATAYRALKIVKMPVHLRWELAPVPHEKGKAHYGGSYLEEYEWWTKPRETSIINSIVYMAKEIFLLKGVWEHNRSLWPFSFSFHTGIYLLVAMVFFLFAGAVFVLADASFNLVDKSILIATIFAYAGYGIGAFGSLGLIIKRAVDDRYRNYNTPSTYFNLLFLGAVFVSGLYSVIGLDDFFMEFIFLLTSMMTLDQSFTMSFELSLHVALAILFIIYLPFTYMIHFVAKYFMYHDVRWNDEPLNPKTEAKLNKLLNQKVSWAGPHIKSDGKKTWIDIATEEIKDE